tara:strand:- start:78744 stop:80168 length:1425 start_codon:yes stop_codon:yes gene_type:complete
MKSNIKYNKIELAISYGATLIVFGLFSYFKGDSKEYAGDLLISTAFYALLYAFYSNKKKLNLKYVLSLPLSKSQLLLIKSVSDLIFFVPAISLAFVGVYTSELNFSIIPLLFILTLVVMIVSLIMFDSDIEQPRLENTRASFINRLIYARKGVNFFFMATLATYTAIGINFSPLSMDVKQYGVIMLLSFVLIFKFNASLKLMKDESLSYFMFKRDLWNMGLKMAVFIFPVILAKMLGVSTINISPYGDHAVFNMIRENNVNELKLALKQKDYKTLVGKKGFRPIHAAIREGHLKVLELLLKNGHDIEMANKFIDEKYQGFKPAHLAVLSKNIEMFKRVQSIKEFNVDLPTEKTLKTPLIVSAENCSEEIGDYLIQKGANINAQDEKGKTPLMYSIEKGCDSLTSLLIASSPDFLLKDKKGKVAYEYMHKKDSMHYLLFKHMPKTYFEELEKKKQEEAEKAASRAIASEKENSKN